jgi:hypothetical protein
MGRFPILILILILILVPSMTPLSKSQREDDGGLPKMGKDSRPIRLPLELEVELV